MADLACRQAAGTNVRVKAPLLPLIREGRLRGLAVTSAERFAATPEFPTMIEPGFPAFDVTASFGLMTTAGAPAAVIDKLNTTIAEIMRRPDIQKTWAAQGAEPQFMTPEEFDAFLRKDIEKWAYVVKKSGATAQ